MQKTIRVFRPSRKGTTVTRWIWKRGKGLTCEYYDGLTCKSEWTLTELLKADYTKGDGLPAIEVDPVTGKDLKRS